MHHGLLILFFIFLVVWTIWFVQTPPELQDAKADHDEINNQRFPIDFFRLQITSPMDFLALGLNQFKPKKNLCFENLSFSSFCFPESSILAWTVVQWVYKSTSPSALAIDAEWNGRIDRISGQWILMMDKETEREMALILVWFVNEYECKGHDAHLREERGGE